MTLSQLVRALSQPLLLVEFSEQRLRRFKLLVAHQVLQQRQRGRKVRAIFLPSLSQQRFGLRGVSGQRQSLSQGKIGLPRFAGSFRQSR